MTAKVVSFINMKGGVGKTTLLFEMAHLIAKKFRHKDGSKFKILLIDTDPQANLTQNEQDRYIKINKIEDNVNETDHKETGIFGTKSIQRLFDSDMASVEQTEKDEVIFKIDECIDLIPGELETIFLERSQSGKGALLRNFILDNDLKSQYDLILIDCPPTYSLYTELSMLISDYYLIPTIPDAYSILGIDLLNEVVEDLKRVHRHSIFEETSPQLLGIIINKVKEGDKKSSAWVETVRQSYGVGEVFSTQVPIRSKLSKATLDVALVDTHAQAVISILLCVCQEFLERLSIFYEEKINE
ncbi:ParA family protein [Weissella paramesenteroides]|uniref:ParA family protein n=1 Tax=Weissella paramesenteroides TaxID=1249 RepID=UPI002E7B2F39|nr:ParA family protein [Weissella paramesenteroides]WPQ68415.1 ParA family protein [Weissella paramesenteroides]